jgi:hypothetical protein
MRNNAGGNLGVSNQELELAFHASKRFNAVTFLVARQIGPEHYHAQFIEVKAYKRRSKPQFGQEDFA